MKFNSVSRFVFAQGRQASQVDLGLSDCRAEQEPEGFQEDLVDQEDLGREVGKLFGTKLVASLQLRF